MPESNRFECPQAREQQPVIESPWHRSQNCERAFETKLFTPEQTNSGLPDLQIDRKPFDQHDVSDVVNDVAWFIEHDSRYGAPSEKSGQIHSSDGLIHSIDFPNNNKCLQINYDDYNSGRIGSIMMDGKTVQFSYDGNSLQSIHFSGGNFKEPIQLQAHDDTRIAKTGSRQICADAFEFASEIARFLKS